MHVDVFVTMFLEHRTSQESPKTAKKPPKMAIDSLQEPLKQIVIVEHFFEKCDPPE